MGSARGTNGKKYSYRILAGRPRRPPGRISYRCEDNIKMDNREMWWGGVDWIDLA